MTIYSRLLFVTCVWSIFKRGVVGSFLQISKKYMPLLVAEFQFRYNKDIFGIAIKGC